MRRAQRAWRLGILAIAAVLSNSACARGERTEPNVAVAWTLSPSSPYVGPATLTVTLRRPSGDPLKGAAVRLEAQMSHAGMAPVIATASERAPGTYEVAFAFAMQGDWVLLVSAALPEGGRIERRIDVPNVQPSGMTR